MIKMVLNKASPRNPKGVLASNTKSKIGGCDMSNDSISLNLTLNGVDKKAVYGLVDKLFSKQRIDLEDMKKEKAAKLLHYSKKEVSEFVQYDFFINCEGDSLMSPDEDGDWCCHSNTIELMSGMPPVRILIVPGTPKEVVLRALCKIQNWIKKEPSSNVGEIELLKEKEDS